MYKEERSGSVGLVIADKVTLMDSRKKINYTTFTFQGERKWKVYSIHHEAELKCQSNIYLEVLKQLADINILIPE